MNKQYDIMELKPPTNLRNYEQMLRVTVALWNADGTWSEANAIVKLDWREGDLVNHGQAALEVACEKLWEVFDDKWMAVSLGLPDEETTVLACDFDNDDSNEPFMAYVSEGAWRPANHPDPEATELKVTHWRHLPDLPY